MSVFSKPARLWKPRLGVWVVGVSAGLLGCTADGNTFPITVTDSAGTRVVTTLETEWDSVVTLQPHALATFVRSGATSAGTTVGSVLDAALQSDGGVAVLDGLAQTVLVFDPRGDEVAKVGRQGEGPGEFSYASSIQALPSGGWVVYDRAMARLTLISPEAEIDDVVSLATAFETRPYYAWLRKSGHVLVWGFDLDDQVVMARSGAASRVSMPGRLQAGHPSGDRVQNLFEGPAREMIREGARLWIVPFGPAFRAALGHDDLIYLTIGERHEVVVLEETGFVQAKFRFPAIDSPIDARELEELERDGRVGAASAGVSFIAEVIFDPALQPPLRPSFEALDVSPSGMIWAKRHEPFRGRESMWWVITREGHYRGRVELPNGSAVLAMGRDVMLVQTLDELDVPSVELWSVPPFLR